MTHQFSVKKYKKLFAGALSICLLFLFDQFTKRLAVLQFPLFPAYSNCLILKIMELHLGFYRDRRRFLFLRPA